MTRKAPGIEIIAAGKVWTSHSINKVRDKEWSTYHYFECPDCKKTNIEVLTRVKGEVQTRAIQDLLNRMSPAMAICYHLRQ